MPHVFTDLDAVTDQVHALFDGWAEVGTFTSVLGADGVEVMRLAVHEWIANLVQHAHFPDGVRCAVEDSSAGFDLAGQIERQHAVMADPAPSERGRGLLMLVSSTKDLTYRPADDGAPQRISFRIHDPGDAFFAPLFRPEDLTEDPTFARSMGDGQVGDAFPLPPDDR